MYADRFAQSRRLSPGGLGIALAINGAVVAGLLYANPDIVHVDPFKPLVGFNVPVDPPPPPPEQAAPPKAEHPSRVTETHLDPPKRTVETPAETELVFDTRPGTGDTGGTGGVTIDPPKPVAAPVLTGAEPDPRFARDFQPAYPPAMRRAGEEGRVSVRVLVGADGRVKDITLIGTAQDDFFQATRRQALTKWRFKPATRDGVAVETWRAMSVRFVLND